MKIRINKGNETALQAALNAAEGRATERCLNAADMLALVVTADLEMGVTQLPKAQWHGAVFNYRMELNLPNAYKWRPAYTHVTFQRGSKHWYLIAAQRHNGSHSQAERADITLTAVQMEEATRRFQARYGHISK